MFALCKLGGITLDTSPGIRQHQRVDDLVAALVLLQLDLGLGRLQELHRAGGENIRLIAFVVSGWPPDGSMLNPARPSGVRTGRAVMLRSTLHRAQRRQLAV